MSDPVYERNSVLWVAGTVVALALLLVQPFITDAWPSQLKGLLGIPWVRFLLLLAAGGGLAAIGYVVGRRVGASAGRAAPPAVVPTPMVPEEPDLIFDQPFYYAHGDSTPFCPRCWQVAYSRIHLDDDWGRKRWECPECDYVKVLDKGLPVARN